MTYGSLFERLNGDTEERAGLSRDASVMASVAAHLTRMLGTRAGSVQISLDYGLPDLNDMRLSLHDARSQAISAIRTFIETHEPRLGNVRVSSIPNDANPLCLFFNIDALLDAQGLKRRMNLSVCLDGNGQVKVSQG
ncbi:MULTISPECIES: type VI secretion system baseplate subunit TssE [unclassified Pseudomonas]|uniref:type VI secretion system baseplate subunit TssE n=1 Tax=unclassified Pseudomonas TaxID=196821 RepID=UPI001199E21B|nr:MULTISPECIES: type VI secretion system baseplate subunit TssE [unclassified Pseudomonas]TWC14477.1 type VI secretion system protein [Pseudomonas sp. SJZ074]TWC17341.1 type VI secretion system protein [Pseudomonas sp. SJZ075]TWC32869.1 type VI secretion system protein [Pseudomonas sp. SJZ085]TWC33902.1 type VI secretion system protein [Pseudomonas sp. SJZ078]TWC54854.1 type VI secretion system protein [Pseudomonas sp. SJZ124]